MHHTTMLAMGLLTNWQMLIVDELRTSNGQCMSSFLLPFGAHISCCLPHACKVQRMIAANSQAIAAHVKLEKNLQVNQDRLVGNYVVIYVRLSILHIIYLLSILAWF